MATGADELPPCTQALQCHDFPEMLVTRTVNGEWIIESDTVTMMSCGPLAPELTSLWDQARQLSSIADMSNMETALATMDMAAVQRVDRAAQIFGERMAESSDTWRYFLRAHSRQFPIPDVRETPFYQQIMSARILAINQHQG